ncbi:uncharacterized protein DDB_G0283697-like, partial [Pectinophora gossypiella]|uniref:uncharacterized protein DDB_G0283697-like n=1 Tax=Pectinophora gossypiella TaxID=13191 RepID=UPI00214EA764
YLQVTDAHIIEKNITESETQSKKSTENNNIINSLNKTDTELNKDQENPENVLLLKCENDHNASGNCTENAPTKLKEGQGSDTVLKYVYKKDDKINVPKKASGHPANSLRRKKRSINHTDDVRYAATAPLIVNYETSHGPPVGTFGKNTASLIRNANLADFNIKTLHANQPDKKNFEIRKNTEKSNEDDSGSKSQEYDSSNERDGNRYDEKRNKQHHDNEDSGEVLQNIETNDNDNRSKEKYKDNHNSGELNDDIDDNYKDDRENTDLYNDSEEKTHEKKGDYRNDGQSSNRYRDNRGSEERDHEKDGDYRDDRGSSERYKDNRDSGERSEYRNKESDSEEQNRERDGEYRNDRESSERYKDNRDSGEQTRERDGDYRNDSEERNNVKDNEYRNDRESNEHYKDIRDSEERGEYRNREPTPRISEEGNENNRKSPYKENNHRDVTHDFKEKDPQDSRETYENNKKFKDPYLEIKDNDDYKLKENYSHSQEKDDSREKNYPQHDNALYQRTQTSKDSNESREQSEESSYPKQESRENYTSKDDSSSPYVEPRNNNWESIKKDEYRKRHQTVPEESNENPSHKNNDTPYFEPPENIETEQEEAIIAIMKRKKPHSKPLDHKENLFKEEIEKIVPVKIKEVDLADFSYETVHVNDKGVVEPVKDTHEDYQAAPSIAPLTTFKPATLKKNSEEFSRTLDIIQIPSIQIDDVDLRPVIEINTDKDDDENSKEALKSNNEDTSLETLLGINLNSDEKSDKIVEQQDDQKGDVKQEFERIPLNYNHAKKEEDQKEKPVDNPSSTTAPATNEETEDDENVNQGTVDTLAPKDTPYDEHLNLKFGDVTVKLPEIKLPEDILAYAYGDPPYEKKEKTKDKEPKKDKFFRYDEHEYNEDNPSRLVHKNTHDHDDHVHDHDDNNDHSHHHDNDDDYGYYGYYGKDKKKDNYKKKEEVEDDNDEEEDLYEKFVRERFGKRGSFHKRSEALTEPKPEKENDRLFKTLENVLLKAKNLEKESEKSGDPNAGYMWTVEYGRPL